MELDRICRVVFLHSLLGTGHYGHWTSSSFKHSSRCNLPKTNAPAESLSVSFLAALNKKSRIRLRRVRPKTNCNEHVHGRTTPGLLQRICQSPKQQKITPFIKTRTPRHQTYLATATTTVFRGMYQNVSGSSSSGGIVFL